VDVTMPQLGETVTEGTITKWLKQVGDTVAVDEPLFEVSTDKVDSEVPSPVAGVLTEIVVPEGDTVEVGARLAVVGDAGAAPAVAPEPAAPEGAAPEPAAAAPAPAEAAAPPEPPTSATPPAAPAPPPAPSPPASAPPAPAAAPPAPAPPAPAPPAPAPAAPASGGDRVTSPLVRRMIVERGLDPSTINGSGDDGRITRRDVEAAARAAGAVGRPAPAPAAPTAPAAPARAATGDERIPFDNIRRRTAEHMVRSKATSAHVATAVEVDFEAVERVRRAHGARFRADEGFGLTYLPFIVRAFCDAVHTYPAVNASVDGDTLVVHHDVHLGIAVDLAFTGLIAPVVRSADTKRLRPIAREIDDLARRARSKQLGPDEILGGTFTITNMGPFGTAFTVPIINQPQVAILATDAIRKRPVVVEGPDGEDAIGIHSVGMLTLTWDHRAFDGAYAASFLHAVAQIIETHDWDAELA
jgi:2-oxoglutarate dehydrogenase E2 component (dihydrolipoamide succinyltransferase)